MQFGLPLRFGLRCEHLRYQIASDVGRAMRTTKRGCSSGAIRKSEIRRKACVQTLQNIHRKAVPGLSHLVCDLVFADICLNAIGLMTLLVYPTLLAQLHLLPSGISAKTLVGACLATRNRIFATGSGTASKCVLRSFACFFARSQGTQSWFERAPKAQKTLR